MRTVISAASLIVALAVATALLPTAALSAPSDPADEPVAYPPAYETVARELAPGEIASEWEGLGVERRPAWDGAASEKPRVEPPGPVPAEESPGAAPALYLDLLLALTIVVAALILVSGLDDAFVDACYWLSGARRRKKVLARLEDRPESAFAIMVPAWKEHDVIAAMIENTVRTLDYRAFRIFCGVYRNDPATAREVDRMAALYGDRVVRVDVPHDGPTCKGDCLNHIVRRILMEEHSSGSRFAGMVLHDCEDVIHPLELKLFNTLVPGKDLVQLPVFSLDRAWNELVAATYIDDFAESHGKDMAVREALIGIVPGAGVATCYSRRGMAALLKSSGGEPFNTATLTEDYDLSFRLKALGMSQTFAHVTVGSVIATHEYFPDKFKAAYRQRARWVLGIAFQGWGQMGWRGSALERYFLFRDRKSVVMAPAGVLAYVLLLNFVLGMAFGSDELKSGLQSILSVSVLPYVLVLNLAFMCNRALQRMYFVGRYYGARHGLLSVVRMPVNNLINFCAVMRAWRLFAAHAVTGKKLAWDKTAHVYPDTLTAQLKTLGILATCCALLLFGHGTAIAQSPPPLTGRAYELADQAYKAVAAGQLDRALDLATEALNHAPGHASLLRLRGDLLAQRGYLSLKNGNAAAAEADFAEAVRIGGLDAQARANVASELAYLALRRNDDAAALKWFQMALESPAPGASRAGLYADAGYAATRLGRNSLAVELHSKAIDEWHAAPPGSKPFDDTALYGMRRSIDSLSRRWGATFSIGHSSTPGAGASAVAPAGRDLRVIQAGAEVSYTPESFGYRDERIFQLYANAFQAVYANDRDYATGSDSRVAGLGARYKPLRDHNLVLAVERRLALGDRAGEDDWLMRVGFSASRETDWSPTKDSWTTWQVYTESAYFIEAERLVQPFEARVGRSWKLPQWHGAVATPYVGIAGEYDKAQDPRTAAGIGPGLAFRQWFGESRYRAFPAYLDFSIQYRFRLTDAKRGGGLFGQLVLSF